MKAGALQTTNMDPIATFLLQAFKSSIDGGVAAVTTLIGKASQPVLDTVIMRHSDHTEILFRAMVVVIPALREAAKALEAEKVVQPKVTP